MKIALIVLGIVLVVLAILAGVVVWLVRESNVVDYGGPDFQD